MPHMGKDCAEAVHLSPAPTEAKSATSIPEPRETTPGRKPELLIYEPRSLSLVRCYAGARAFFCCPRARYLYAARRPQQCEHGAELTRQLASGAAG